jgi:ABC-type branched-subunit amino acid transport system substrate-binding protein/TolA-binding protein
VILPSLLLRGAILIFVMGMALCIGACQPGPLMTPPPSSESALFGEAEEHYRHGRNDRAIEAFALYVARFPHAEKTATALSRMASIHLNANRYEEVFPLLERIVLEYPDHPEAPPSLYGLAALFSRLGEYGKSNLKVEAFLKRYPDHSLKGEGFLLLGKNQSLLKDYPAAYAAYSNALRVYDSSGRKPEVEGKIIRLIEEADLEGLRGILRQARRTAFAPHAYHRMALLYLEKGYLQEARESAMALARLSEEQHWVNQARQILEKTAEEEAAGKIIACLLPLTGPFAIYGQEVLNGVQLGLGARYGFLGEANLGLEILVKDTQGDPEEAASQVEELAANKRVLAVIGPLASKSATAAAKKAQERGIPIITLTQKEGITEEGDMVFRNFLTPAMEVEEVANKVAGEMGLKKFGILYPDNAYGRYLGNLFWDGVEELGGMITAVESYKPKQTDLGGEIKKMVGLYYPRPESDPASEVKPQPIVDFDAVFIPDAAEQVALIAPQFPFYGVFNLRLLGSSLWLSSELVRAAGDYLQGAIFPSAFFSGGNSEVSRNFVRQYKEDYGMDPGVLAATGYDSILLMRFIVGKRVIRTREDLLKALKGAQGFYGVTGHIAFGESREVLKKPTLLTIQGQKIIPLR